VFTLESQRHVVSRSISYGWSSSILGRKLAAHTTAMLSSKRVCYLTSEQYVVITGGHCSSMERQRTSPGPRWAILKKSTSTSLNLTHGLQVALILISWIMLFGVLFSNESTTNDNSRRSGKNSQSVSLITVSMNSVDVLKLLSRMAADTSSIATWFEQPRIILIL